MPIYRHRQERDYTVIPNALLRDERLELRDIGLLARMIALPDDWSFSVAGLRAIIPGIGRDALRDSLRRIENAGYLRRDKMRGRDGKIIGEVWTLTDDPEPDLPSPGLPSPGKPPQQNKKSLQKNYQIKRGNSLGKDSGCRGRSDGRSSADSWGIVYDV